MMSDSTKSTRVEFQPSLENHHDQLIEELGQNIGPISGSQDPAFESGEGAAEDELVQRIIAALKTIYDPEIPVNIYDLGLIYRVEVKDRFAEVDMTLTAPGCPVAQTFPGMVEGSVKLVPGVEDAVVNLVWDPPWRQEMISEEARLELGLI
jgi:FeS assembly SUF system protein